MFNLGHGTLLCGDPSSAASMKIIQELESFNFSLNSKTAYAATASSAGAPIAESVMSLPPSPTAEVQFNETGLSNLEILLTQMGGAKQVTGTAPNEKIAVGFGGSIELLSLLTWVFIPEGQKALGVAAPNAIWMPRAKPEGLQNFLFNRLREGESNNPVSVTLRVYRGKTDAKASTPNAIPAKFQYGWIGDPAALGLAYALPALS